MTAVYYAMKILYMYIYKTPAILGDTIGFVSRDFVNWY